MHTDRSHIDKTHYTLIEDFLLTISIQYHFTRWSVCEKGDTSQLSLPWSSGSTPKGISNVLRWTSSFSARLVNPLFHSLLHPSRFLFFRYSSKNRRLKRARSWGRRRRLTFIRRLVEDTDLRARNLLHDLNRSASRSFYAGQRFSALEDVVGRAG